MVIVSASNKFVFSPDRNFNEVGEKYLRVKIHNFQSRVSITGAGTAHTGTSRCDLFLF